MAAGAHRNKACLPQGSARKRGRRVHPFPIACLGNVAIFIPVLRSTGSSPREAGPEVGVPRSKDDTLPAPDRLRCHTDQPSSNVVTVLSCKRVHGGFAEGGQTDVGGIGSPVVPMAGQNGMMPFFSGGRRLWFLRAIAIPTGSAGNMGIGKTPVGSTIRATMEGAAALVIGRRTSDRRGIPRDVRTALTDLRRARPAGHDPLGGGDGMSDAGPSGSGVSACRSVRFRSKEWQRNEAETPDIPSV